MRGRLGVCHGRNAALGRKSCQKTKSSGPGKLLYAGLAGPYILIIYIFYDFLLHV